MEPLTDASDVAGQLVHHDQQHATSTTGIVPGGLGTAAQTATVMRSAPTPAGSGSSGGNAGPASDRRALLQSSSLSSYEDA
ncbi:hypothetical protein ACOMD4_20125 [Streptomyces anulatus]|uniref:hypothetical protein n=1 Tax=Streptomyces anulatus TaxID=1892 RepID=UPI003B76C59D